MADWIEAMDLDSEDLKEGIILFCILLLITILIVLTCCILKRRKEEKRRMKEHLTEEANDFFSFHAAIPHSIPKEPGPLASLYKSTIISLTGKKAYVGHPYTTLHQTPFCFETTQPQLPPGDSRLILESGQPRDTPLYPPSYFRPSATFPAALFDVTVPSRDSAALPPKTPPPPYEK